MYIKILVNNKHDLIYKLSSFIKGDTIVCYSMNRWHKYIRLDFERIKAKVFRGFR